MHELKVNNLIICAYLNITDLLVSLAKVKIKLISFSTDVHFSLSTKFKHYDKTLLSDCCEQLTAGVEYYQTLLNITKW